MLFSSRGVYASIPPSFTARESKSEKRYKYIKTKLPQMYYMRLFVETPIVEK